MGSLFKDKEHLVRMAALFVVGIALFVLAKAILVPDSFGRYGHYRAEALDEAKTRAPQYAGYQACSPDCHGDVIDSRTGSKHAQIHCETCHGPAAAHVADYEKVKPTKPDPATVCLICHSPNVAKPAFMKQVDPQKHYRGQSCGKCHKPHHPETGGTAS